jgi:2-polyprenyl-6-hydroxyphenyl methylase/3-demethylubiquinone-9 3-methyltransferase
VADSVAKPIDAPDRFAFGDNWRSFLQELDETRIGAAVASLTDMLATTDLTGRSFLDIGSGSGLFSLAARRLGARVLSFDYDAESVACTQELRRRYYPDDPTWTVAHGSVLDRLYLESLGQFDVVYSWGVLHHTGAMWRALENASIPVAHGGAFFIAIYNDQGGASRRWLAVKRAYQRLPPIGRSMLVATVGAALYGRSLVAQAARRQNPLKGGGPRRGMTRWHDLVDWVGGYPFEVARPEAIIDFFHARGFTLVRLTTAGSSIGCNEFVFVRSPLPGSTVAS